MAISCLRGSSIGSKLKWLCAYEVLDCEHLQVLRFCSNYRHVSTIPELRVYIYITGSLIECKLLTHMCAVVLTTRIPKMVVADDCESTHVPACCGW